MRVSSFSVFVLLLVSGLLRGESAPSAPPVTEVVLNVGGSGNRPYVAIWIETKEGALVRTLGLWGTKPKYQRELRAWKSAGGLAVDGLSAATRPNGAYRVLWDGLDAEGRRVPAGELVFKAECVREERGRNWVWIPVQVGQGAVSVKSPADGDILSLEVKTLPAEPARP